MKELDYKFEHLITPELLKHDYKSLSEAWKAKDDLETFIRWGINVAKVFDQVEAFSNCAEIPVLLGKLAQNSDNPKWQQGVQICALIPNAEEKVQGYLGFCKSLNPDNSKVPEEILNSVYELLKSIQGRRKDELTEEYVKELCRWGNKFLTQALQEAMRIDNKRASFNALIAVAQKHIQLGDSKQSEKILDTALSLENKIILDLRPLFSGDEPEYRLARINELRALVEAYSQMGDAEQVYACLDKIMQFTLKIQDVFIRSNGLRVLAEAKAKLIDGTQEGAGLERVLRMVESTTSLVDRFKILSIVKKVYAQYGEIPEGIIKLEQQMFQNLKQTHYVPKEPPKNLGSTWVNEVESVVGYFAGLSAEAGEYAQLGLTQEAIAILDKANEFVGGMARTAYRSSALSSIAKGYLQASITKQATELLVEAIQLLAATERGFNLTKSTSYEKFLEAIRAFGQVGHSEQWVTGLNQILQAVGKVKNEDALSQTIHAIAEGCLQSKDSALAVARLDMVLPLVVKFKNSGVIGAKGLTTVAEGYIKFGGSGQIIAGLDTLLKAAESIEKMENRFKVINLVSKAYGKWADTKLVAERLEWILYNARKTNRMSDFARVFLAIGNGYAQLGNGEKAAKALDQALQSAESSREATETKAKLFPEKLVIEIGYYELLGDIANAFTKLPDERIVAAGLDKILQAAITATASSAGFYGDFKALTSVSFGYAQLKDRERAFTGLEKVTQAASAIHNIARRSQVLSSVARGYAHLGDVKQATSIIEQILKKTEKIEKQEELSGALCAAALGYVELGNRTQASVLLSRALQAADGIKYKGDYCQVLSEITQGFGQLKDIKQIITGLEKVMQSALRIEDEMYRSDGLVEVIEGYKKLEITKHNFTLFESLLNIGKFLEQNRINKKLKEVLKASIEIKSEKYRSKTLLKLAQAYIQFGDTNQAAMILDQAKQVSEGIGDKGNRLEMMSEIAVGYAQLGNRDQVEIILDKASQEEVPVPAIAKGYMIIQKEGKVYKFLNSVSNSEEFFKVAEALLETKNNISENNIKNFVKDQIYLIMPLAVQYGSNTYLKILQQIVTMFHNYLSSSETSLLLNILEKEYLEDKAKYIRWILNDGA